MEFQPPRQHFSQNFLHDQNVIEKIILAIAPKPQQHFIEIGPGRGALTIPLLKRLSHLTVIEIDDDLIASLQALASASQLTVIHQDVLKVNFLELNLPLPLRVVGNLPYHISSPILFHLLHYKNAIYDMHFMLQKEVVDRMAAGPHSKTYGRLSIMTQYYAKVEKLFSVPAGAFFPAPQVVSAVVRLTPYGEQPWAPHDPKRFEKIVAAAFSMRRKTLRNALKGLVEAETFERAGIAPTLRPEDLSVADYVKLAQ